jgi:hypothetical protein
MMFAPVPLDLVKGDLRRPHLDPVTDSVIALEVSALLIMGELPTWTQTQLCHRFGCGKSRLRKIADLLAVQFRSMSGPAAVQQRSTLAEVFPHLNSASGPAAVQQRSSTGPRARSLLKRLEEEEEISASVKPPQPVSEPAEQKPTKAKPTKPTKAKRRRKEPAKVEGYQEAIDHWTAITLPWVQAPATRYPWVFQGQNHDGSKVKRWLRASQGLEHLKLAMNRYVDAVQAGTTWPAGDPPLTRHFDRELARWLAAPPSSSKPDHWMTTGEGVGTSEPPASNVADTSTLTKAAAWLDSGDAAALLFIVAQEFGDDLPAQDYPPRELWLESLVSHPAVVWSELRRRRDQQPVAVIR